MAPTDISEQNTTLKLSNLQTEGRNVQSSNIDIVSTLEMCSQSIRLGGIRHSDAILGIMNSEDSLVAQAVGYCIRDIAAVIDLIADRVKKGGRVIYIGAGTSGR